MTKSEIAKVVLERRARMTHVVVPGEIHAALGADGVAEALQSRWLVADTDSGFLCVTNEPSKVDEMQKLVDAKPEDALKPAPILVTDSHAVSLLHTNRRHALHEIAAPGTGHDSPGLTAIAEPQPPMAQPPAAQPIQPAQPPPQAPAAGGSGSPGVGANVTVARQGITANGVIEKMMPDGRFSIGYPANVKQRPPGDNVFSKDEMTIIPNSPQRPPVTAS